MEQRQTKLPLEWLSSRRTPELRVRSCYSCRRLPGRPLRPAQTAGGGRGDGIEREKRYALRLCRLRPGAQLELLNRKLDAANAEIRRYQTRLYACEREMVALRQENAELGVCVPAGAGKQSLPPVPPQPKVLGQPGLPVIVVPPGGGCPQGRAAPAGCCTGNRAHRRNRRRNAAPLRSRTGSPPRHSTIRPWIWYISWKA